MIKQNKYTFIGSNVFFCTLAFAGIFVSPACRPKTDQLMKWDMLVHDTGAGVSMTMTGASVLFEEMSYEGTNGGSLTIFDPSSDRTILGGSAVGWSSPEKPGRAELSVTFWSEQQMCEIEFGSHSILIRDRGKLLELDGIKFRIDPNLHPKFVIREDGQVIERVK